METKKIYQSMFMAVTFVLFVACGSTTRDDTSTPTESTPVPTSQPTTTSTPSTSPSTPSTAATSIDVLVLYDSEVKASYSNVNTRVNHLFAVSNNVYRDSQLNITINPTKILFFDAQTHPAVEEIAFSAEVKTLREKYKADTVLIYQINPDGEFGQCGVAYGAGAYDQEYQFKDAMFAQVEINCPTDTTAHEIGHNMGLLHSQMQDGAGATPYSYGLGHGVDGKFATIMAYAYLFNTNNQIPKFSSPDYECTPGEPCGIAIGQAGEAHATKVLEYTTPKIANLY